MNCHVCGEEAVGRCFTCGALFCAEHGDRNCAGCAHGIVTGDYRADRISQAPRTGSTGRRFWWRPQVADDYEPPACSICGGLARLVCRNCRELYCADHAGAAAELCARCARSSRLGIWVMVISLGLVGLLLVFDSIVQLFRN